MTAALGQSSFLKELDLGYDYRGLVFQDRNLGGKTLVLWLVDQTGEEREEGLSLSIGGSLDNVQGIYGRKITYSHDGATLSLTISGSPVYIQGDFEVE